MKQMSKEHIMNLVESSPVAVKVALQRLYDRQTATEQEDEATHEHNKRGFNAIDAPILTSFVKQLKDRGFLSAKQIEIARRRLRKYSRQLYEMHLEKVAAANA